MTPLLLAGGVLAVVGSSVAAYFVLEAGGGSLGRAFQAYEESLERHANFLLLERGGVDVARAQLVAGCACLALLLVTQSYVFGLLLLVLALAPPFLLWRRHTARIIKLERQLDSWLLMLANALKATSSVGEAIASTVVLVPRPFSEEIDLLVKEIHLGVPLDRALNTVARRIGSTVISGALMMIVVARQTGGDLSDTLERASGALRETARLEGVLRTKTAEGRGQVLVLASVPFVLCIVITWLDRSWFDPMLHHAYGRAVLAACAAAWTIAAFWAHQIARTDL